VTLPFGGNTHINLLVSLLIDNFFGQVSGDINNNSNKNEDDNADTQLGSKPILNDPAALQRLHDASISAIHELSSKTRTNINVPYLSMDATTRQPRHLELDMSRNVVDATVESWIGTKLVPHLQSLSAQSDQSVLSSALPPPTDLTTLLSSIIAHILERTSLNTPFALRAILLVGGGARIPLVRESMTQCVKYLAGDAYTSERLIMPEGEMGDELAVLGAAVWGSRRG
jgi:molecular chaperone DnaK (HSP70)